MTEDEMAAIVRDAVREVREAHARRVTETRAQVHAAIRAHGAEDDRLTRDLGQWHR